MSIDKVIEDQHAMYGKERIDYLLELGLVFDKLKNRFIEEFDEDIEEIADDLLTGTLEVAKKDANIEYNHKAKLPQFIINTMNGYDNLHDMLTEEYYNDSTEEIDSDEIQCWIGENFDKLCLAWLVGYEAEKEQKYCVELPGIGFLIKRIGNEGFFVNCHKLDNERCTSKLTRAEICVLNSNYLPFAVPVEEVNRG